ncbi:MAG: hypothetical protein IRY91_11120, partial [Gemmatimonadaceae bacterium]|nr:hypothetical protein [Gemmatimonadaceae bacterium]
LAGEAAGLHAAWASDGGDYGGQLATAGEEGSLYVSVGAALQEVIMGMIGPTEEVAAEKIGTPLQTGDSRYEESRFSDNTLADLQNDLSGARDVYLGGVSTFVAAQDARLDQLVRAQFDQALEALAAVGPSFDAALHDHPEALRAAQQAIFTLNHTLMTRVAPLVGGVEGDDD